MLIHLLKGMRGVSHAIIKPKGFVVKPRKLILYEKVVRWNHTEPKKGVPEWKSVVSRMIPIGICLIAVMQWRAYRKGSGDRIASQIEVTCYCMLPLKSFSRMWGMIADTNLPEFLRPYLYGLYINAFGVNLSEAENEDLRSYPSLADFFSRSIKLKARPIDMSSELVAPCDGTVLHVAPVHCGKVEQVKGITYSIDKFLGENVWCKKNNKGDYHQSLLYSTNDTTKLFQCVIYLAPGDYHRFHSPTVWKPSYRRHFPGELLSVNPAIAKWIPGLFILNERVVYVGEWQHGFFSYTAVGATNVGSVRVHFDEQLQMNNPKVKKCNDSFLPKDLTLQKGDLIGEFRMGSTIVVLFEAPSSFQFNVKPGQKVKMGQKLGHTYFSKYVDKIGKPIEKIVTR